MTEQSGLIPIGQAARLLMISEERIRQLVKQGYVPKSEKRGYVQLVGSVQGYLKYLKEDERRSTKSAACASLSGPCSWLERTCEHHAASVDDPPGAADGD